MRKCYGRDGRGKEGRREGFSEGSLTLRRLDQVMRKIKHEIMEGEISEQGKFAALCRVEIFLVKFS